jgi:hypothetical protein
MTKFQTQFKAARRVSTPLVAVRTADPWSATQQIIGSLNSKADETPVISWDILRGLRGITKPGTELLAQLASGDDSENDTAEPTTMLRKLTGIKQKDAIVVAMNFHLFWKNEAVRQGVWNLRDQYKTTGDMLVMTATAGAVLPPELTEDVLVIDEPLPTPAELREILRNIVAAEGLEPLDEETTAKAIDAVAGLASFPAEQAMAMSITKKDGIDLEGLWERKKQAIEQTPGLSVHRGDAPEPVGLENAKGFLTNLLKGRKRYRAILFIDEVEKGFAGTGTDLSGVKTGMTGAYCTWVTDHAADGLLCIGVAGGGKTLLAKWAGSIMGIPTILWDFNATQSGIIGSTEERMRSILNTVDAISQGSVLIIGTCNSIGQMPPEVLRRFNRCTFFFDLMSGPERKACWRFYMQKQELADQPLPDDEGWTGSEIKECCEIAWQLRIPLVEASKYVVPVCRASAEKIKSLRQGATGKYISASAPGIYNWSEQAEAPASKLRAMRQDDGPKAVQKGGKA